MKKLALIWMVGCGGGAATPVEIVSVSDLGVVPLPAKGLGRDGGMSGAIGGRVLWTFGDTFLTEPNRIDASTLLSATGGWATVDAPLAVAQAMDGDQPAQLVPYTADEIAANRADLQSGYALWPGVPLDVGEATAVVPFQRIKRGGGGFAVVGVGTARIAPGSPTAVRTPGLLFEGTGPMFEPQLVLDGEVWAFACEQRGFLDFACRAARAPVARAEDAAAYAVMDGYVIDNTSVAPSISFNAHLGRYLAVTCDIVSSTVRLRTAEAPEGPWDDGVAIEAGTTGVLSPVSDGDYNYLCVEHPELSHDDVVVVGYSRPTEPFRGDVRLAEIRLR